LEKELEIISNVNSINTSNYNSIYKVTEIFDSMRDKIGHIPYTKEYYNLLGTLIYRRFFKLKSKPYKVIVLDCDNTIWKGICGEDGYEGVLVEGSYYKFQQFLVNQTKQGMLLCLCSKNVEDDVWNVFEKKSMPLQKQHITDSRINWEPKSKNIKNLAKTLNLGLDSFIFIDDNPVECAEVKLNCPEVFTILWTQEGNKQIELINNLWVLDKYDITEEDEKRTKFYQENVARKQLQETSNDFSNFIKSLNLKVKIKKITKSNIKRISQLTERTNQFNFTTIRRSVNDLEQLIKEEKYECFTVDVSDKFGSYGLVGVIITKEEQHMLIVDSFILSCRVLGRGVEYKMLSKIGRNAKQKKLHNVKILFNQTPKNLPAMNFIQNAVSKYKITEYNKEYYLVPSDILASIKMNINEPTQPTTNKLEKDESIVDITDIKSIREKEKQLLRISELSNISTLSKEIGLLNHNYEDNIHNEIKVKSTNINNTNQQNNLYDYVLDEVKNLFSEHLNIRYDEICESDEIEKYRIESYRIMDIMVSLGKDYKEIPSTLLFECRTIKSIVDYLIENYKETLENKYKLKDTCNYNLKKSYIKEHKNEKQPINNCKEEDIAIIGINGIYPNAKTIKELWKLLLNGETAISEIPQSRWNINELYDASGSRDDKTYSKWGALISDIDKFEARFFNISPKEAELIDPQQRLFLQVVWGLLEDAGYTLETIDRNTGVYAAVVASDYGTYLDEASLRGISAYRNTDFYQIPNRISYFYDLHGPSISVNTACSGSGTAIHLAYESLKRGECNTAIVGGINLFIHPSRWIQYSKIHFHSPDGVCRPFGEGANGTVFGEGVGAVLLKRLSDAKKDNDNIYGIIKGSAINSGGRTNGFTVPNPQAHKELIKKALKEGNINPKTVSYVEAHGTGTSLGDPIEIRGLSMAFNELSIDYKSNLQPKYCALGSIKGNIGHSESAAAMSGIIKILLQMKYETLVPSLNSKELNPQIDFEKTPFHMQQNTTKWHKPEYIEDGEKVIYPKIAGISSFGAGGSNSHIIIEEYTDDYEEDEDIFNTQQIIVLSSKDERRLKLLANSLLDFIDTNIVSEHSIKDGNKKITLSQVAYTLQIGRLPMEERVSFIVSNFEELMQGLKRYFNEEKNQKNIYKGNIKSINKSIRNIYEEDSDEIINMFIRDGKLHKLAKLWILGVPINWTKLYSNHKPKRVSLPRFLFEGERYWIPDSYNVNVNNSTEFNACDKNYACASLEEFENSNIEESGDTEEEKLTYYSYNYVQCELENDTNLKSIDGNTLLFDTDNSLYNILKVNTTITLVKPNNEYKKINNEEYEICVNKKEDYKKLIQDLANNNLVPQKIVYKWDENNIQSEDMDKHFKRNFYSILYLSQSLMEINLKKDITVLYIYSEIDKKVKPYDRALSSFAKTINQENPRFTYKIIEIQDKCENKWLKEQIINELKNINKNVEIRYVEGKRYIKEYNKINSKDELKGVYLLKEKGVYLITGGLGGLGLIFSEYLAKIKKAKLILTGRSKLTSEKEAYIKTLQSMGSEVIYIRCDVSNSEDVKTLIKKGKEKFGHINGIIHGAGVLKSEFILNKTNEDVDITIAPKVRGTINLDKATENENLDFFILFSSLSASMGSVGYCDYGTANSFMDNYALYRENLRKEGERNGISFAIAWPFWNEGGMQISEWSKINLKNIIGMIPLETDIGTKALFHGLSMKIPNLVVIQGDEKLGLNAFKYNSLESNVVNKEEGNFNRIVDEHILLNETTKFLKTLLSEETKLSVGCIDSREGLEIYGIDSIMIMSLTSKLEKHFGALSKTLFFEYQTIEALAEYFIEHYKDILIDLLGISKETTKEKSENTTFIKKPIVKNNEVNITELGNRKLEHTNTYKPIDIAIIGVSGTYPEAKNLDEFWENLKTGRDSVTEIPKDRWDYSKYYDEKKGKEGKMYSKWGAFLDDVDKFDPLFFNISPKEAKIMDPQERLFLQCAWHTFEDAGYCRKNIEGTNIGVFAGVTWGEYQLIGTKGKVASSSIYASVSNRVSYIFNLHGPSITIDTMCASSLTAIHMACESIYSGQCSMALAGGVNLSLHPNKYLYLSQGRFASSNGRCKAFGNGGDGYVPGEGVGSILVKSLEKAKADGDHIYGVIKSTSINHGGKTNGYTVPNPIAQGELIVNAINKANINARTISYIEAHGTGTSLGVSYRNKWIM
jgi:polyketide synthase PksN